MPGKTCVLGCCAFAAGPLAALALGLLLGSSQKVPELDSWTAWTIKSAIGDLVTEVEMLHPPKIHISRLATAYWRSEVTYALAHHGFADLLAAAGPAGGAGCAEAAASLALAPDVACRYMRAGRALGLLRRAEREEEKPPEKVTSPRFALTEAGELLRSDVPGSMRDFVLYMGEESREAYRAAGLKSIATGRSGFFEAFGEEHFEWHARHPEKQKRFDASMTAMASFDALPVLGDWEPPAPNSTICDIGGGQGHFLALLLNHYPSLTGILVDQPTVTGRARTHLAGQGVSQRVTVINASILEPLPRSLAPCDVFLLKLILHDWNASAAAQILRNVAAPARRGARLDVVEHVVGTGCAACQRLKPLMDIHMQANHAARERTLDEFQQLFKAAHLQSDLRVVPVRGLVSLLQVHF